MTQCTHPSFTATANIRPLAHTDGTELTIAEFSVFCAVCRMPFKFEWNEVADPNLLPLSIGLMQQRPWVTPYRETLCATITPHPEGDFYGQHHEPGNA